MQKRKLRQTIDMTDHHLSLFPSSPQYLQVSTSKNLKGLKGSHKEKAVKFLGSVIATAVSLQLILLQVNVSRCETYKVHESKKPKVHTSAD